MPYPAVIHKDADSDYGVTIPDLPGCFTVGKTMEDAIAHAREAIICHLQGLAAKNEIIPAPSRIGRYIENPLYKDGTWVLVTVDLSELQNSSDG